jgi:hypothetical protein
VRYRALYPIHQLPQALAGLGLTVPTHLPNPTKAELEPTPTDH